MLAQLSFGSLSHFLKPSLSHPGNRCCSGVVVGDVFGHMSAVSASSHSNTASLSEGGCPDLSYVYWLLF